MFDQPEIKEQMRRMRGAFKRMMGSVKNRWKFEPENAGQIIEIAVWLFLPRIARSGVDPLVFLRQIENNTLDDETRAHFWDYVTVLCREEYQAEHYYSDKESIPGRVKRRRIPKQGLLAEHHGCRPKRFIKSMSSVFSSGAIDDPLFDPNLYVDKALKRLAQKYHDVAILLMYEDMTVKAFRKRKGLNTKKWYKLRDETKSLLAIEICRIAAEESTPIKRKEGGEDSIVSSEGDIAEDGRPSELKL